MVHSDALQTLQQTVWDARLPLEIRLAASECRRFDTSDPYLVSLRQLGLGSDASILLVQWTGIGIGRADTHPVVLGHVSTSVIFTSLASTAA